MDQDHHTDALDYESPHLRHTKQLVQEIRFVRKQTALFVKTSMTKMNGKWMGSEMRKYKI